MDAPRPPRPRELSRAQLGIRARVLGLCALVLAVVLLLRTSPQPAGEADRVGALVAHLAVTEGLEVSPRDVVWLAPARGPFAVRPVVFVASEPERLPDVYYADVRASADGSVLDVMWLENLTRSSSAAEFALTPVGEKLAFAVRVGRSVDAVVLLDPRGEPKGLTADWPWSAKLQNAITNLQETGRMRGFGRFRYSLVPPAEAVTLHAERAAEGNLVADVDGERIAIETDTHRVLEGRGRVRGQAPVKGRPGTLTWAVDTARKVSWIGPGPIAWLEHTVFGLTDRAQRAYHGVVQTDVEAEVREAMPVVELTEERRALLTVTDPELGWPPGPLEPQLDQPVRGEGQWLPVVDDPFVNESPNAPPAFYQTFIRVDSERLYTRVYITAWDPRQVQLHVAMGTREPESATGETGSGMIARAPELLSRLVGAFNGGFQAMHGEFGMMSEGRVYLPPKPWAATVAVFDDGRVGMGSWPGPGREGWDEEAANRQIPENMISMRQNLTSVVEDGEYNPWKRWWWGAAPTFAKEQTYIHRSGLCLTEGGHMAYLWGESMGPEELGRAMLALRCVRGMHLDMNSKHTGFEFYRPVRGDTPPLGRQLTDAEFEGKIPEAPGFVVRARKAVTTMTPLRFPRYLMRDPRDFFYLSLVPVLPGPDLPLGSRSIPFDSSGLPHAGWPPAFARVDLTDSAGEGSWLVRIDARRAVPDAIAAQELSRTLALVLPYRGASADAGSESICIYRTRGAGRLHGLAIGRPPADAHVLLCGPALSSSPAAQAALGIDRDGFLLYGEAAGVDAEVLSMHMRRAGVSLALVVEQLAFEVEGQAVSVDGRRKVRSEEGRAVALKAETRPAAGVMYPAVEPMPYRRWGWLQGQRVRYFPEGEPRFKAPTDALVPP